MRILTNVATGRFHPIYFRMAPLPGGAELSSGSRYKSSIHHTAGFGTLDEAVSHIAENAQAEGSPVAGVTDSGRRWDWDGEGVPALVEVF